MTRAYWNEELETMPPDALRRYEAPLLAGQVEYLCRTSAWYRQKLSSAGLKPGDVTCHEALAAVPFTEKEELAQSQRDGELIGPHVCAPPESIIRLTGTGGTSGAPMRIAWTRNDVAAYNEMGARALWAMGCRPGDLVINCFNYSLYAGGVMDHMSFETLGAMMLAYGVGNSRRLIEMLAAIPDGKCLYSTPSYAVRLAEVASEAGIDPGTLNLAKGFFSGEAGLQVPGYRRRIESLWGMAAHDLYGIAELGCQSAECEHRTGMHFCGGGLVIVELIDPDSGAVLPMRDGEKGELVYTALKREASPLLRLRSHDIAEMRMEPCACGRTGVRFHVLGRGDDMFVVKGVNVYPASVQEILSGLQPGLTGEFQIALDRPPPFDYAPRLRVEVARDMPPDRHGDLMAEVADVISRKAGFSVEVELAPQGAIASEHKTRRVLRLYKTDSGKEGETHAHRT